MIYIALLVCLVAKCILFANRDIKWWKGLIPFYNIYIFGQTAGKKRLGLEMAILLFTWVGFLLFVYYYEIYIISSYIDTYNAGSLLVPQGTMTSLMIFRCILVALTIVCFVIWEIIAYNFTKRHISDKWKRIVMTAIWGIMPAVAYVFFACNKKVYKNGKLVEKKVTYNDIR